MSNNPYQASDVSTEALTQEARPPESPSSSRSSAADAYNVVSDTVVGVNTRLSDNRFQAIFVLVSVLIAALIGMVLSWANPRWGLPIYGGALVGSFGGLIFGIFTSGIFLMIYRAARHLRGKHD